MILTPDRRLRVFISSTLDLTDERAAVKRSVESLNLAPVMFEAGARPHPPRALYRAYVEQSDVFVGLYARRYGWTAPGMDVSGLEDEYNLSTGMPRLVYIRAEVEREPELVAFLNRVRDDGLSYRPYRSTGELEKLVKDDVVVLLTERFHAATPSGDEEVTGPVDTRIAPLPVAPPLFVGRGDNVAELRSLLERDDVRLVTLVGPGGIGKTRLGIAAAEAAGSHFDGGTFFVPLATVREAELVDDAISSALGVATCDACPAVASIADFFEGRRALLVLDNFEQVLDAAGTVADLLAASPHVTMLVTSRAPLRIRGEREFTVEPLAVPATADTVDPADYAAVALFVDAARAVRPDFALDSANAAAIVEVCRELDGLPLAIELAAAMTRVTSPAVLLERLRDRRTDLGGVLRDLPARHQGLRATIAWSHQLLEQPAQKLFGQLGVFRGGFTLEHVEQVCDVDGDPLELVGRLVEHSLVRADITHDAGPRFSMLATIRRFAAERLDDDEARDAIVARHAGLFTKLLAGVGAPGGRHPAALDVVEADLDNVRAALERLLQGGDADAVASAVGASWWFWWIRGYVNEGKLWANRALAASPADEPRAKALSARAMLAIWSGDYDVAITAFAETAEAARRSGDTASAAYADIGTGLVTAMSQSVAAGAQLIRRGVATFDELGDELGATTGVAALAWVQAITREFDATSETLSAAINRARAAGSAIDEGIAESALAQFHLVAGEYAVAAVLLGAALDRLAAARHIGSTILTLEVIAELALASGGDEDAVGVLGATAAIRSSMGTQVPPAAAARLQRLVDTGRQRLGDRFAAVWETGAASGFADAVARGRGALAALAGRP